LASTGLASNGDSDAEAMTPEHAVLEMLAWDRDRWHYVDAETGPRAVLPRRGDGNMARAGFGVEPVVAAESSCPPGVGAAS